MMNNQLWSTPLPHTCNCPTCKAPLAEIKRQRILDAVGARAEDLRKLAREKDATEAAIQAQLDREACGQLTAEDYVVEQRVADPELEKLRRKLDHINDCNRYAKIYDRVRDMFKGKIRNSTETYNEEYNDALKLKIEFESALEYAKKADKPIKQDLLAFYRKKIAELSEE